MYFLVTVSQVTNAPGVICVILVGVSVPRLVAGINGRQPKVRKATGEEARLKKDKA